MELLQPHGGKHILLVIAHPDDETLWCGGTMLMHPGHNWFVACLSRKDDPDRAPKFQLAMQAYNAIGVIGDLDDGPEQQPLPEDRVRETILELLPEKKFDLVLTHNPAGEYTRHLRHEEVGKAAIGLWKDQKIIGDALWTFAYEDGGRQYFPRAIAGASNYTPLPQAVWREKYRIITEIYGFGTTGFEAQTCPKSEAFWQIDGQRLNSSA